MAGLLLMSPLVQSDSDQLHLALVQIKASLNSLDLGDAQGAIAHAEAAQSHVDIAAREATGNTLRDLKGCKTNLKETQQQAAQNNISKARTSASKAGDSLRKMIGS